MNHRNTRILTLLSLAVLWLANTAHAQYVPRIVKVNVPFDFTVSDKSFPSGEYSLVCTPLHLKLRDSHNRVLASLFPHSVESMEEAAATKLQFSTEGDRALLRLWIRGDRQGYELARSKAAVALAKQRSRAPILAGGGGNR